MNEYNFDFAISAEISAEIIKEMVKQIVEEQTGRKIRSVVFKSAMKSYDYRDQPGTPELTGCTVFFE